VQEESDFWNLDIAVGNVESQEKRHAKRKLKFRSEAHRSDAQDP
jgi:hypothetical protein